MWRTAIGAAFAAAVIGVGGGAGAALLMSDASSADGVPQPLAAVSPSVPYVPAPPTYTAEPDMDYPALTTPTRFTRITVGNSLQSWSIIKPVDWQAYCILPSGEQQAIDDDQVSGCVDSGVYFRPSDEPIRGGYSFRVQTLSSHLGAADLSAAKIAGVRKGNEDVEVLPGSTDSVVYFTFLAPLSDGGYLLRHNFFQWLTAPGSTQATLEMSVTGREVDDAGLRGLFSAFAARTRPVIPG